MVSASSSDTLPQSPPPSCQQPRPTSETVRPVSLNARKFIGRWFLQKDYGVSTILPACAFSRIARWARAASASGISAPRLGRGPLVARPGGVGVVGGGAGGAGGFGERDFRSDDGAQHIVFQAGDERGVDAPHLVR